MGSLGYIVGGALQGIGGAMGQQAQADADQRRQIALENLRQQNQQTNMRMQADLNDENAAKSDARKDYYGARETERGASVDAARDQRKFGYEVKLKQLDFANDQQMAQLNSSLSRQNDAASQNLRASIDRGEVKDVFESGDGQYWARYGDGSMKPTGVKVPPKAMETRQSGFTLRSRGGGAGIGSGAGSSPAPAPAKPAPAKPASKPAPAKPAAVKPGSAGSVSMSEIDELAKARGLTRAEAMRFVEGQGFSVQRSVPTKAPAKPAPSVDDRWKKALSGQTK